MHRVSTKYIASLRDEIHLHHAFILSFYFSTVFAGKLIFHKLISCFRYIDLSRLTALLNTGCRVYRIPLYVVSKFPDQLSRYYTAAVFTDLHTQKSPALNAPGFDIVSFNDLVTIALSQNGTQCFQFLNGGSAYTCRWPMYCQDLSVH
jgi:hypothetical protein